MPEGPRSPTRMQDVHGPRAASDVAQPMGHGVGRHRPRNPRRFERRVAKRQTRGERRRVGAAGPVGRAVRVPWAADVLEALAVVEHVHRILAMAARDHDGVGTERVIFFPRAAGGAR